MVGKVPNLCHEGEKKNIIIMLPSFVSYTINGRKKKETHLMGRKKPAREYARFYFAFFSFDDVALFDEARLWKCDGFNVSPGVSVTPAWM